MSERKSSVIAVKIAFAAVIVGLITFTLSWNLFDYFGGPMPGYDVLLFPANLSLVYVWHPMFTEEVNLLPKLGLMMIGQFVCVYFFAEMTLRIRRLIK